MNIKRQIFLALLLFIIPLNNVFASSDIYVKCPSDGEVGSVIDCELWGASDIEISAISTKLSVSNNLEFVSFKTDSSWQGNGDNGDIALYTYPNKVGDFILGVISIKIKDSGASRTGTLYFNDVYFYKADFSKVNGSTFSKNIKVLSSNNNLASLSLIGYDIVPKFHKDITEYRAKVDSNTVVIEANAEDEFSSVSGYGRKELGYGDNTFDVTVTSEIGTKKKYKLIVTRTNDKKDENYFIRDDNQNQELEMNNKNEEEKIEQEKNKDSKLKSLKIEGYNIDFNMELYHYDIEVSSDVDRLEINAIPNNDKAKVTVKGNENLIIGINEITINVVAEDGSNSIYTIYVTKKSDVCVIKSIKILNYDLNFDCSKYDYKLRIGTDDSLDIEVIPGDDKAKVQIYHNDNLKNGDVIVILVSVNNVEYEYHIEVLKNDVENFSIMNNRQFIFLILIIILMLLCLIGRFLIKKKKTNQI